MFLAIDHGPAHVGDSDTHDDGDAPVASDATVASSFVAASM